MKNISLVDDIFFGELLKRVLKKVFTDEVVEQFSWFGWQKKYFFVTTVLADIIKSNQKNKLKLFFFLKLLLLI